MERDELLLLGRMDGKLDGIVDHLGRQDERLDAIDARLRKVEERAAVIGGVSGGVISVGMAIVVEGLKHWLGRGGPGNGP